MMLVNVLLDETQHDLLLIGEAELLQGETPELEINRHFISLTQKYYYL